MPISYGPLFFRPQPTELANRIKLALFFSVFFYLLYGSGALLADIVPWRFSIGFDWERRLPFWPNSAWIYLSISPFMLLPIFVIRDPQDFRLAVRILCVQVIVASIFFVLVPVTLLYPPRDSHGALPLIFVLADMVNLTNNEFPSLHVCFAVSVAGFLAPYAMTITRILIGCWAAAIIVSTMTIHEHHLLAVVAGAALAVPGLSVWQRRALVYSR
jgi:membrane-associated phospholipid phosphatase